MLSIAYAVVAIHIIVIKFPFAFSKEKKSLWN